MSIILPLDNAASTTVPVRGMTKLPVVDLGSYPPARLVYITTQPHADRQGNVSTQFSYLCALQEVDAQFSEQLQNDPVLRKVYREMRSDYYSRMEIENDDRLYSLVLMLENALKTRLRFAVLQHLRVVNKYDYIVSSTVDESGIDAKKKALLESSQEVLVVLSILKTWATDEFVKPCEEAWDVLGLKPPMTTPEGYDSSSGKENA